MSNRTRTLIAILSLVLPALACEREPYAPPEPSASESASAPEGLADSVSGAQETSVVSTDELAPEPAPPVAGGEPVSQVIGGTGSPASGAAPAHAAPAGGPTVEPPTQISDIAALEPGTEGSGDQTRRYVVQSGDSLWTIAAELLGDGRRWQELYEANRETIGDDPNGVRSGMVLVIPVEGGSAN